MAHRPLYHSPRGLRVMKQKISFEGCGSGTPGLSVERLPKTFPTFHVTPHFTPPSPPHPKSSSTHLTELPSPPSFKKKRRRGGVGGDDARAMDPEVCALPPRGVKHEDCHGVAGILPPHGNLATSWHSTESSTHDPGKRRVLRTKNTEQSSVVVIPSLWRRTRD